MQTISLRNEPFGGTVYCHNDLSYFFINQKQLNLLMGKSANSHGIDFSNGRFDKIYQQLKAGQVKIRSIRDLAIIKKDALVAPIRVYFEICLRCDGQCIYCLNNAGSARANELSASEIVKTLHKLGDAGVFEVRLTGGEPTLHPALTQFCRIIRRQSMALSLNSHLKLSPHKILELIEIRPNLLITSLDAVKEVHEKNRGLGYDRIVKNINLLRLAEIPVRLNCMLSNDTLPHLENFIETFAPLGCGFCFILTRPVGRAAENFNPPPLEKLIAAYDLINKKKEVFPKNYFSTSFHVVMDKELEIGEVNLTGCNAIQKSFNINSDGSVLPCAFLYELDNFEFNLGNVREHNYDVLSIWQNSQNLAQMRQVSSLCNRHCIGCDYFRNGCLGSCVFMAMYAKKTGKLDPYCKYGCALKEAANV